MLTRHQYLISTTTFYVVFFNFLIGKSGFFVPPRRYLLTFSPTVYINAMLTTYVPLQIQCDEKWSNRVFHNSLNTRGMMSAFHSNSNTQAMTSFPVFNTSNTTAPRTQRGSDFPLEVTVEHIVEVHTGSQASHEKESDLADDRFVLSQAVFDSEKRKESV